MRKADRSRYMKQLRRALDWEAHDLMQQRSPTMPDCTPRSFVFKADDASLARGKTAEQQWPWVFDWKAALQASKEAAHLS